MAPQCRCFAINCKKPYHFNWYELALIVVAMRILVVEPHKFCLLEHTVFDAALRISKVFGRTISEKLLHSVWRQISAEDWDLSHEFYFLLTVPPTDLRVHVLADFVIKKKALHQ